MIALAQDLVARWGMKPAAMPIVERFLQAWQQGHTLISLAAQEADLLRGSAAVSDGETVAPFVLTDLTLQPWRLYQSEMRVARRLKSLAIDQQHVLTNSEKALFGNDAEDQINAAELALNPGLTIITGGPGTGKTFTASTLLRVLLQRDCTHRVAIAAPTGKAAKQLGGAVQEHAAGIDDDALAPVRQALLDAGEQAKTLHRLLAWRPGRDTFLMNAENPLAIDTLMVDEVSMIDLAMWDHLLAALATGTRLILLGDHRQLESVQPGRVLGEVIAATKKPGPLSRRHIDLVKNRRSNQAIGDVAAAARSMDAGALIAAVDRHSDKRAVVRVDSAQIEQLVASQVDKIKAVVEAPNPMDALEALNRFRILVATNEGAYGVQRLNLLVERLIERSGNYSGKPILVIENDPHTGLFNGDTGVLWRFGGELKAYFSENKIFSIAAVPKKNLTAWAMTIHRSQGSEYETVVIALRPAIGRAETAELLYTGITRAKEHLLIAADESALAMALQRRQHRASGLQAKLFG